MIKSLEKPRAVVSFTLLLPPECRALLFPNSPHLLIQRPEKIGQMFNRTDQYTASALYQTQIDMFIALYFLPFLCQALHFFLRESKSTFFAKT